MKTLIATFLILAMAVSVQAADVQLTWDANTEPDLSGYRVYWGTESGVYNQEKGLGLETVATGYVVPNLAMDGTTYYFAVTAFDNERDVQESAYSDEVSTNGSPSKVGGVSLKIIYQVEME